MIFIAWYLFYVLTYTSNEFEYSYDYFIRRHYCKLVTLRISSKTRAIPIPGLIMIILQSIFGEIIYLFWNCGRSEFLFLVQSKYHSETFTVSYSRLFDNWKASYNPWQNSCQIACHFKQYLSPVTISISGPIPNRLT